MYTNLKRLLKRLLILLLFTTAGVQAQTCYQIGLDEGKTMYDEALKLKNANRCDDAAQQYWSALRRFRLSRRCADLPRNHELDVWEDRCINGITNCGYIPKSEGIERQELNVTPRTLNVNEKGDQQTISVTTNVSEWAIGQTPSWLTAVKQGGNRISVKCLEHTGTNVREGVIVISANTLQVRVTVRQAGGSCYETGMSESRAIFSEAQRLKSIGEEEAAALQFLAAFKKVQETEEQCTDIPENNDLETLRTDSHQGIEESGFIIEGGGLAPLSLSGSLQYILFDAKGGENRVTISTNASGWQIVECPEWCATTRRDNILTVACGENPEATVRRGELVIASGTRQMTIAVVQEAKSCYAAGMDQSRELYDEALQRQSTGKKDEAAQLFLAAFKKVQETEEQCTDLIAEDRDRKSLLNNISKGIKKSGYTVKDNEIVRREKLSLKPESMKDMTFFAMLSIGTASSGTTDYEKTGAAFVFGADLVCFFKPWLGAGLKLNTGSSTVDIENEGAYNDRIRFVGPGLYGRWEKERIAITAGAGIGALKWKMSYIADNEVGIQSENVSSSAVGGFLSAGVNYKLTQRVGAALNVQSMLGKVKIEESVRNPAGAGIMLGLNFRF